MLRLHLFCFVFSFKYNNESITTVKCFRPWVLTQNGQDGPYHGEHEQIGWTVIYFCDSDCFDPIWGRMQTSWVWNETDLNSNWEWNRSEFEFNSDCMILIGCGSNGLQEKVEERKAHAEPCDWLWLQLKPTMDGSSPFSKAVKQAAPVRQQRKEMSHERGRRLTEWGVFLSFKFFLPGDPIARFGKLNPQSILRKSKICHNI